MLFDEKTVPTDRVLRRIWQEPKFAELRARLESMWLRYEPYADRDFRPRILSQFHACFWEMYLTYSLLDFGFDIKKKHRHEGPDVHIIEAGQSIWVEAIAPSAGNGPDSISIPDGNEAFLVPEDKIVLRFTSAVAEKYGKYQKYLSKGLVSNYDPFIIAINGQGVPFSSDDGIPYIVQSVLPFGLPSIIFNFDTGEVEKSFYTYRPSIDKSSGVTISTDLFLSEDYAGISGLIYTQTDVTNIPNKAGSDFLFLHNPLARNPLQLAWLRAGLEYRMDGDNLMCRRIG